MLVSTRGIVLYQADYSETSLITKIYTEQFGLQSYIVKGVRRKGSPIKRNLFGPLSLVDIVAYKKENTGLHLMKDVSCQRQLNQIAGDIARSSVMVFMNELLYRSIAGEMPDKRLYTFIYDSLLELDEPDCRPALMPLLFAWKLTSFLGFGPHNNYTADTPVFDMEEGNFCAIPPAHPYYLLPPASVLLSGMLADPVNTVAGLDFSARAYLLDRTMDYYRLHLPSFGEMKSHHVLNTVLRDPAC